MTTQDSRTNTQTIRPSGTSGRSSSARLGVSAIGALAQPGANNLHGQQVAAETIQKEAIAREPMLKTDSEAVSTLQFDFEAEDYTYDDDPDTP